MTKLPALAVFCAITSPLVKHRVKYITSEDLGANATMPLSLVYAQNIIAVTRASMGLDTKALKSITA
jgi:hypothetical protein